MKKTIAILWNEMKFPTFLLIGFGILIWYQLYKRPFFPVKQEYYWIETADSSIDPEDLGKTYIEAFLALVTDYIKPTQREDIFLGRIIRKPAYHFEGEPLRADPILRYEREAFLFRTNRGYRVSYWNERYVTHWVNRNPVYYTNLKERTAVPFLVFILLQVCLFYYIFFFHYLKEIQRVLKKLQ